MTTMRFVAFSLALCMLAGLATAEKKGLPHLPALIIPGLSPSRYPGGLLMPVFGHPWGSRNGRRHAPLPLERSDPSGSFGKKGQKKKPKDKRDKRNRRDNKELRRNKQISV
uniref:Putative secreted protein n=1 Tax=Amblyomma americanum TaxID=6943 RepID=A0A0C9R4B0_AMBAM